MQILLSADGTDRKVAKIKKMGSNLDHIIPEGLLTEYRWVGFSPVLELDGLHACDCSDLLS